MINGSVYLVVKDFEKSLDFYEKVFDKKVSAANGKRFAMFNIDGLNLCLMNGYYDEQFPEQMETKGAYFLEYDNMSDIADSANSRKVFITPVLDIKPYYPVYDRKEANVPEWVNRLMEHYF